MNNEWQEKKEKMRTLQDMNLQPPVYDANTLTNE